MMLLASDYFLPVCISLILLCLWFTGRDFKERDRNQKACVCSAITIGMPWVSSWSPTASGVILIPFQDMPQLLEPVTMRIFYPVHDPSFPSNSSALTFAAAAGVWQFNRKWGYMMLIPAILMPLAKVYAAVYYPSDVIGGAILGILTSYFIAKIFMPAFHVPVAIGVWFLRTLRVG